MSLTLHPPNEMHDQKKAKFLHRKQLQQIGRNHCWAQHWNFCSSFPVKIFWGKKVPDKIRKLAMVLTVQTQVVCFVSEIENPWMPYTCASQLTPSLWWEYIISHINSSPNTINIYLLTPSRNTPLQEDFMAKTSQKSLSPLVWTSSLPVTATKKQFPKKTNV